MEQRNIRISSDVWKLIDTNIVEAKGKGVNESRVLLKGAALIISAKNSLLPWIQKKHTHPFL
ncbi:hypothetical protein JOC86_003389 [Bacillus pakistanensis]|uniref:Uncharacterized protein n=1 Tax=Rossellomorea pakistanensis TaxID=992288 RepID=A0ABS2NG55_9BACI|nr:hypothetical protein [Bacillus pakistanensis]MBM7586837.1 hypothetical protein [Bacillus pakistanensis]